MTNKENVESADRGSQMAVTVAVHLVSQVLDEACIIVNAAKDFGQPWRDISNLKTVNGTFVDPHKENSTYTIEMSDNDDVHIRHGSNAMATSTPQKFKEEIKKNMNTEACIIGQGDYEEIYSEQDELKEQSDLSKSTSTFINRLFDMSDVEYITEAADVTQKALDANCLLTEEINNIVESCIETALSLTYIKDTLISDHLDDTIDTSRSSEHSGYSFLDDATSNNFVKNIAFYIDDEVATHSKIEIGDPKYAFEDGQTNVNVNERVQTNDVAFYENAYITLNRDYEQYSDEEDFVHQDSKTLALQDVELSCAKTSSVKLPSGDRVEYKDLATTSAVSASAVSRKSGLVRRCRLQGARILSCLRGWWWRRKLPGRHREPRILGTGRGQCPLSPSSRLRAASLVDHRLMRSPSPSRPVVWKFNTINETMVNSAHWNEYSFQTKIGSDNY